MRSAIENRIVESRSWVMKTKWMVVICSRQTRLMRCQIEGKKIRMTEEAFIKNDHESHELPPPTSLTPAMSNHSHPSLGHVIEEHASQYAHQVIHWIQQKMAEFKMEELIIVSPPDRESLVTGFSKEYAGRIVEERGNFGRLDVHELEHHPRIHKLLMSENFLTPKAV
jgi:hypothetical protein